MTTKAAWYAIINEFAGYRNTKLVDNAFDINLVLNDVYYDGELVSYRLADFLGSVSTYNTYADNCYHVYITNYAVPSSYQLPGYWCFLEGLIEAYIRRGIAQRLTDAQSIMAVDGGRYMYPGSPGLNDEGRTIHTRHEISREFAYGILNLRQLRRIQNLTTDQTTLLNSRYADSLTIIDDWSGNVGGAPATQNATYFRPFMGAITAHALINFYEQFASASQKITILAKLTQLANYAYLRCWNSTAFNYTDRDVGVAEDLQPQPDLNMLIAPWFAWLWSVTYDETWRTKARAAFEGGVPIYVGGFWQSGSYLGGQSAVGVQGKQLDQQLVWGAKYWDYIEIEAPTPDPAPVISAALSRAPEIWAAPLGIKQVKARLLQFVVTGIPAVSIGEGKFHATIVANGPGDYTLTLNQPASRSIVVVGCICLTASLYAEVGEATTKSTVRIKLKTNGNLALDGDFHLTVMAYDHYEQY